jgi:hypothetical protein
MFDDQQTGRLPPVARLALTTSGIADVRSADQEGRPMVRHCRFQGCAEPAGRRFAQHERGGVSGFVDRCDPGDVGVRADQ